MNVDRGSFLMLVTTLAAGGSVGYVASEKRVIPAVDKWVGRVPEPRTEPVAPPPPPPPSASTLPPPAPPPPPAAGPVCDDSVATAAVGDCPGPGLPTVEGGCGSFASVRCNDLKTALKPKVAAAAVSCITKLNGQERCDPNRIQLCGHLSLMNACADVPPPHAADAGPAAESTPVSKMCQGIIDGCGASPVAPSMPECRQLLSGMSDAGREKTKKCMATHCFDRGLVGCEAIDPPPKR